MRVVIDTNRLESEELRAFLELSSENLAVIPDYSAMEIFKPRDMEAVYSSLRILSEFPAQTLMLKSTSYINNLDARKPTLACRMIDKRRTREFSVVALAAVKARGGHKHYLEEFSKQNRWANAHLLHIKDSLGDMADAYQDMRELFTKDELRRYANREPLSRAMRAKIFATIYQLAHGLADTAPNRIQLPRRPYLFYHFVWRVALCTFIGLMETVRTGTIKKAPDKARNDQVDAFFAAYGTYFNGLMTSDKGPLATHHIARVVLKSLKVRLSEDYLGGYDLVVADEMDRRIATQREEQAFWASENA